MGAAIPAGMPRHLGGASWGLWEGAGPGDTGSPARARRVDRGAEDERPQGRHPGQQRFDGAGARAGEEDTVLGRFALCRPGEAEEDHGRGLARGQRGLLQRLGAQGLRPDSGDTRPQEPPGVRQAGRRGGASAGAVTRAGLALVFPLPPRAVAASSTPGGGGPPRRGRHRGDCRPRPALRL
jgi:hypothetical protein